MSSRFTERADSRDFRAKWALDHEGSWRMNRAKRWVWEEAEAKKVAPTKIVKEFAPKSAKKKVFKTKIGD